MFMCPECDTLYCENCARTLSDLENACWVCDTTFDDTKPTIPYRKENETEDIKISEDFPKK